MKVVVVDDELYSRESVIAILNEKFPEIEIAGQAGSVREAIETISDTRPELVFLDIDLPDGSGFDILNSLKPIRFKIIFITAHLEYALKAIKFSAFDYILKPVSSVELIAALDRALMETQPGTHQMKLDAFFGNYENNKKEAKKMVLKTSESIHLINIQDIIRCEADNNYTTFFLNTGEKIIVSKGLKEYEEMLNGNGFFRVHQSHLVNIRCISRFDKRDGGSLILADKTQVPVSQRKRQKLMDLFDELSCFTCYFSIVLHSYF